jgi:hypothetical protein
MSSHEWDQLPLRGGPSARSGHRIAVQKGRAILFGGFYDNGRDVRWVAEEDSAWVGLGVDPPSSSDVCDTLLWLCSLGQLSRSMMPDASGLVEIHRSSC